MQCTPKGFSTPLSLIKDPSKLESITQAQLDKILSDAIANKAIWKNVNSLFDNQVSADNLNVRFMRSIMISAGPVKDGDTRYDNIKDNPKEQDKIATDFQKTLRDMAGSGDEKYANVNIRAFSRIIYNVIFQKIANSDVAYAVFSFIFVFGYIWFHVGSFFITSLAMIIVLLSFPMTYLVYTGIF